jgi:antirestriction protein ArdC
MQKGWFRIMADSSSKVQEATDKLLKLWESGQLPEVAARSVIQRQQDSRPSDSWSLSNNILQFLHGTDDARGFRQWEQVGRKVRKGSKAFYILGPCTKKITDRNDEGKEVSRVVVIGFKGIPVFRLQDTDGAEVIYPDYKPVELPPLADVAAAWGLSVSYAPFEGREYGFYTPNGGNRIVLRTHEEITFFHELTHAAHERLEGSLKSGQDSRQEIVAEATAATLCLLYGFEAPEMQAAARRYVAHYASVDPDKASKAIIKHLSTIQKVLDLILTAAAELEVAEAA